MFQERKVPSSKVPSSFKPKLVALDLDGTLLNANNEVSARTACALERAKARGIKLVLCTGRPPRYTRAVAKQLDLEETVITYNGASVHNFETGSAEHMHQLDAATTARVIRRLRAACPGVLAGLETTHGWYLDEEIYTRRKDILKKRGLPPPDGYGDALEFADRGALKLLFRHPDSSVREMAAALNGLDVYATWSSNTLLEVQHKSVNKRAALEHLTQTWAVQAREVAAFGDQNNDREMLAWAGCGVAMGNACPEALAAADLVTDTNDNDGVARVLETWL